MDYAVGTKYTHRHGKILQTCTVIDVYKTYNAAGDLVKTRYVSQHDFCGQPVTDFDVCAVSIARGLIEKTK